MLYAGSGAVEMQSRGCQTVVLTTRGIDPRIDICEQ